MIYYLNSTSQGWLYYIPFWLCIVLAVLFLFAQYYLPVMFKLLHHHVYDDFDMDTVVGSVVQNPKNQALWGIRNEDKVNWTYQKADGTQIPVAPGKTAGIAKGVKILFPESTGEFA